MFKKIHVGLVILQSAPKVKAIVWMLPKTIRTPKPVTAQESVIYHKIGLLLHFFFPRCDGKMINVKFAITYLSFSEDHLQMLLYGHYHHHSKMTKEVDVLLVHCWYINHYYCTMWAGLWPFNKLPVGHFFNHFENLTSSVSEINSTSFWKIED